MFGAPVPLGRNYSVTTTPPPTTSSPPSTSYGLTTSSPPSTSYGLTTSSPPSTSYGLTTGVDGCPQVDIGEMPLMFTLSTGTFWSLNMNQFNVGGVALSWAVVGTLPPGITLNTSTGVLSGVPTTTGVYTTSVIGSNNCADSGSYQSLPVDFEIV